jgi:acetyl esterase/lipase
MIRNVSIPSLTAFLPEGKATDRTAIIICPGGAFRWLTWQNEGTDLAKWFAARGVAAFVLKYRLVVNAGRKSRTLWRTKIAHLLGSISHSGL